MNQKMHKAISIIQFKAEGQIIKRHPEFGLEKRNLLHHIDFERGVLEMDGREYKTVSYTHLADGAEVLVPNDVTNEARALLLLQDQGLLTLKEDAGLTATINDITENPKNLDIVELEAAQLPRSLQDRCV